METAKVSSMDHHDNLVGAHVQESADVQNVTAGRLKSRRTIVATVAGLMVIGLVSGCSGLSGRTSAESTATVTVTATTPATAPITTSATRKPETPNQTMPAFPVSPKIENGVVPGKICKFTPKEAVCVAPASGRYDFVVHGKPVDRVNDVAAGKTFSLHKFVNDTLDCRVDSVQFTKAPNVPVRYRPKPTPPASTPSTK